MFFSRYTQFVQSQGLKDSQCIVFAHHQPSAPDLAKSYLRKYAGPSRFYNVAILRASITQRMHTNHEPMIIVVEYLTIIP